jgi:hypothetical protein
MNGDDRSTVDVSNSILEPATDDSNGGPSENRPASPDGAPTKSRRNYDGSRPLKYPGYEAVAQYMAAPKQQRRFKSVAALAKRFGVSRITMYRWAQHPDVVRRTEWLSVQNMVLGDLIACREWPAIMRAQVAAALAGDSRAAIFCQKRAWPEHLNHSGITLEDAIKGAINVETFLEVDEVISQSEHVDTANENPEVQKDDDIEE